MCSFFAEPDLLLQKPGRPLRCPYLPTYLPTLLTYGKLKKKSLEGEGGVIPTRVMVSGTLLQP